MGNPFTRGVGNVLTKLMGNVLTMIVGKVLDIYKRMYLLIPAPMCMHPYLLGEISLEGQEP